MQRRVNVPLASYPRIARVAALAGYNIRRLSRRAKPNQPDTRLTPLCVWGGLLAMGATRSICHTMAIQSPASRPLPGCAPLWICQTLKKRADMPAHFNEFSGAAYTGEYP